MLTFQKGLNLQVNKQWNELLVYIQGYALQYFLTENFI